jgi:hypothetical protein
MSPRRTLVAVTVFLGLAFAGSAAAAIPVPTVGQPRDGGADLSTPIHRDEGPFTTGRVGLFLLMGLLLAVASACSSDDSGSSKSASSDSFSRTPVG